MSPEPHEQGPPPGTYPVVIIGSGPGGMQTAYCLRKLGIDCVVISEDSAPGGMFRQFPLFQRLITWTKPHAPAERKSRAYERYDWNSLLGEQMDERSLVAEEMDGTSYFPSRPAMQTGLEKFASRTALPIRYGCQWKSTRVDADGFAVETTIGEYRCRALIVAVGRTRPWKPETPGMENVPHYVDTRKAEEYAGRTVFLVGKRNSGFEIADALLPHAKKIYLGSPRPAQISVLTRSTAGARARYLQPYEDHVLGGGNVVMDVALTSIERNSRGYRIRATGTTKPTELDLEVDDVIAATGFTTPLMGLGDLGVKTFMQGRLPAQTPFWESTTVPGIFFAGSITQGAIGMKKYGIPSNSAAVHGFRYNAAVLARHVAEKIFGKSHAASPIPPEDLITFLLDEATEAPELWNQQSYLARVVTFDDGLPVDHGIVPLAHFVDSSGPDALALAIETDDSGDIHPALYVRRDQNVTEHLMEPDPFHDYRGAHHRNLVSSVVTPLSKGR